MNAGFMIKHACMLARKHEPVIELVLGMGCMGVAVVDAVHATTKAADILAAAEARKKAETGDKEAELTKTEVVKSAWKEYIRPAVFFVSGAVLLIRGNMVQAKRIASLAAMSATAQDIFQNYRCQVAEAVGGEKEKEMRQAAVEKTAESTSVPRKKADIPQNGSECLCYDAYCGQYFRSSKEKIENAICEAKLSTLKYSENFMPISEIYDRIPELRNAKCADNGWYIDGNPTLYATKGECVPIFDSCVAENGEPCLIVDYECLPYPDEEY